MIESDRHAQYHKNKLEIFSLHQQKWIWNQSCKLNLVEVIKGGINIIKESTKWPFYPFRFKWKKSFIHELYTSYDSTGVGICLPKMQISRKSTKI